LKEVENNLIKRKRRIYLVMEMKRKHKKPIKRMVSLIVLASLVKIFAQMRMIKHMSELLSRKWSVYLIMTRRMKMQEKIA
jgi:ribosomal protein L36